MKDTKHERSELDSAMAPVWALREEIKRWTARRILTMKLPPARCISAPPEDLAQCSRAPSGGAEEAETGGPRSLSGSEVRRALLADDVLFAMVEVEVFEALRRRQEASPLPEDEVRPYVCVVTQRVTQRLAGARAQELRGQIVADEQTELQLPHAACSPEAEAARRELQRQLEGVLATLSPSERLLVEMMEGQRYDEAARRLGISRQTAKNRASELRKQLRYALLD